jgi:toxin ParE1/3/4
MKIEWTQPALLDLESIRDHISRDSECYAARFIEKFIEAVESLKNLPKIGRFVPEAEEENIREVLLHNYRIIYRVENNRILVLTIVHGARDLNQRRTKPWDII